MDGWYGFHLSILTAFVAWMLVGRSICARSPIPVWTPFVLSGLIPLVMASLVGQHMNTDVGNLQYTATLVRSGQDIYNAPWPSGYVSFHPYIPLHAYMLAAIDAFSAASGIPFAFTVKIPSILATMASVEIVRRAVVAEEDIGEANWIAVAFAINPVSIWITAVHGQFDAIPVMLVLLSWYVIRYRSGVSALTAGALFGAAIAYKTWPVIVTPLLLSALRTNGERLWFTVVAIFVPAACIGIYCILFATHPRDIWDTVYSYRGLPGLAGYSELALNLPGSDANNRDRLTFIIDHGSQILACALAITTFLVIRLETPRQIATLILVFYVFAPALSDQYYMWVIPFALLARQTGWLLGYSLFVATLALPCGALQDPGFAKCGTVALDHQWLPSTIAWLFVCLWCGSMLLERRRFLPESRLAL